MPESLVSIFDTLDSLLRYDGAWQPLRAEQRLLEVRLAELRERHSRLDDVLVVALVGGSGVGKSTLLNALAGDTLAKTSEFRPCTAVPTIYHPPGVVFDFDEAHHVSGSALEHLVLVDTPDSDTILREHRQLVERVLAHCDLVLICASSEKYLDEATWSLLRPLRTERAFVCVETKALGISEIRSDWLDRLDNAGFTIIEYFRVRALRSLDRKLAGTVPVGEELDFPRLETFLRESLDADRIARIKRSNAAGLLSKTVQRLETTVSRKSRALATLTEQMDAAEAQVLRGALEAVSGRLCGEPHLWTHALGREVAMGAKGLVGMLYRAVEALHGLPARLAGWGPRIGRGDAPQSAPLFAGEELFHAQLEVASSEAAAVYARERSHVEVAMAKAGFKSSRKAGGNDAIDGFRATLRARMDQVLRGPARDEVQHRAGALTSWPVTVVTELPPMAFLVFAGYKIVASYFLGPTVDGSFLLHTCTVLLILLGLEVFLLRLATRWQAWGARRAVRKAVERAFTEALDVFAAERESVRQAQELADTAGRLRQALQD